MEQVNIYEAKTNLSQLLSRALLGEDIVITQACKPIVALSIKEALQDRVLG